MNHKNLTVCKANKVIEAGYKLTLNEQRVILACIAQVNSTEELLHTNKFELFAKDFAKLYGISEHRAYGELQDVAKQLFHRYVIINNPDPENPKLKQTQTHWISSIDYIPDDGKIVLFFAHKILPYLGHLKGQFTRYKLEHIGKMTSIYAIRLYELLVQWQSTGKREVDIDWLKKQFQIEDGYDRMFDLKKRVLDPAINDINKHSNLNVEWTQRKTGRRVTHLLFTFSEKQQPKTAAKPAETKRPTKKELEQKQLAEQKAALERQKYCEEQRNRLSQNLSLQFSKQAREDFIASLDEQAQQQLIADILEEVKLDDFSTASIKKKGLNTVAANYLIVKRIPNFAESKAAFIEAQLKLKGF
jgi:plasmid replication initiation protein